ncbi:uncharacterized protein K460DRAFT_174879 [Cucurbitaria berberidis CBS 394.84]|uniref:Uncharacterized protein n=1 Tax=Cucurbitaria berberidis CBS 394.84 TaxID=1168544 RepID=A0A9P4G9W9_9PLEO|nr:uncharacterized protein K460DRAFT_174879 [Cucurbitaria berberidis CBS 394.84]KAF1841863.1 hypothetical protein K460DRAFT_174879 [Cucurbitaria berberidis CBS 394.84]
MAPPERNHLDSLLETAARPSGWGDLQPCDSRRLPTPHMLLSSSKQDLMVWMRCQQSMHFRALGDANRPPKASSGSYHRRALGMALYRSLQEKCPVTTHRAQWPQEGLKRGSSRVSVYD